MLNSFGSRSSLRVGGRELRLSQLSRAGARRSRRQPAAVLAAHPAGEPAAAGGRPGGRPRRTSRRCCAGSPRRRPTTEIAFMPARVILQDFTGVPAVVDLAAMRDAIKRMGGDPNRVNPLFPAELVIDHSVQVDESGHAQALTLNNQIEFNRNKERYVFLRWGQSAFRNFAVVPPDTGIVHQVNLEYLARVVFTAADPRDAGELWAYPDTLVGTDSHTTMVNGLGVLGWGVGGIEAEAAMLGQPMPMLIPQVVGLQAARLAARGRHRHRPGADRHRDPAQEGRGRQVRRVLRRRAWRRCRWPTGPPSPTWRPSTAPPAASSRSTTRPCATCACPAAAPSRSRWSRPTARSRGMFAGPGTPEAEYSDVVELDLAHRRAQRGRAQAAAGPGARCPRSSSRSRPPCPRWPSPRKPRRRRRRRRAGARPPTPAIPTLQHRLGGHRRHHQLHQHLQPVGAGGRRACWPRRRSSAGLSSKPWVKTSLAPGSQVVTDYLDEAGPDALPRPAALPDRGLRLHHLHRQLRAAARRHLRRPSRTRTWWSPRCCRATATSRAACTPRCAPTT